MFWGRLDKNSGFHGNQKLPLTYNGKNVRALRPSLLIGDLNMQVTRTGTKSRKVPIFGQIRLFTLELLALERQYIFPLIMKKIL